MARQSVHRALHSLETGTRCSLFRLEGRNLQPTDAAHALADVAREVLAINPLLPVAVASGYISDELQAQAQAAGVTEVVFKTDAVEAFCEVVARLVRPAG